MGSAADGLLILAGSRALAPVGCHNQFLFDPMTPVTITATDDFRVRLKDLPLHERARNEASG